MRNCGGKGQLIVLATHNPHKLREIREILREPGLAMESLEAFPHVPPVMEEGISLYDNALRKAVTVARHTGLMALADDSGLEVDFLQGRPGVYSARYAGEEADDEANNRRLLAELAGVPPARRGASFICWVVAATAHGHVLSARGECRGWILESPRGGQGFGYDPLFYCPELACTFAQVPPPVKNLVSHRARALQKLKRLIIDSGLLCCDGPPR